MSYRRAAVPAAGGPEYVRGPRRCQGAHRAGDYITVYDLLSAKGAVTGQLHRRPASLCAAVPTRPRFGNSGYRFPMMAVLQLLDTIIGLYTLAVVISVVLTWLVQFNVVNTSNQLVYMVGDFLFRITEPILKRIRSVVPPVGGMDLSPLILLLALFFIRALLPEIFGFR